MSKYTYPWQADTVHFTADSIDHTADGWHWHGGGGMSAGAWKAIQRQHNLERIRDEDDRTIMRVIRKFLQRED